MPNAAPNLNGRPRPKYLGVRGKCDPNARDCEAQSNRLLRGTLPLISHHFGKLIADGLPPSCRIGHLTVPQFNVLPPIRLSKNHEARAFAKRAPRVPGRLRSKSCSAIHPRISPSSRQATFAQLITLTATPVPSFKTADPFRGRDRRARPLRSRVKRQATESIGSEAPPWDLQLS
jgi:hypothetical protein